MQRVANILRDENIGRHGEFVELWVNVDKRTSSLSEI